MKYNMTKRLVFSILAILVVFSLLIGVTFLFAFTKQMTEMSRQELEEKAQSLVEPISTYLQQQETNMISKAEKHGKMGMEHGMHMENGYNDYLGSLSSLSMGEVWVVDRESKNIGVGNEMHNINYAELPTDTASLMEDIYSGSASSSESFSSLFANPTVTAGAPIYDEEGNIIAAVLLHNDVAGIRDMTNSGMRILFIILFFALVITIILTITFARRFVLPLKRMEVVTKALMDGNYQMKTEIIQTDEIGSLANHIDDLAMKLEDTSIRINRQEQQRRDLIANVSHELRTPVTVIRGSLEALKDKVIQDPKQIDTYYQQMIGESLHLERLVNDLLELSRLQNSSFEVIMNEENVIEILEDAVRAMNQVALKKDSVIRFEKGPSVFIKQVDYGRLRQMFMIVIDNAIKFSNEHSPIYISCELIDSSLRIIIKDEGIGIATQELPYIFERFNMHKGEHNPGGTGLGLAIAKQIANRHQIHVSIESEEGVGTSVTFQF